MYFDTMIATENISIIVFTCPVYLKMLKPYERFISVRGNVLLY